MYNLLVSGYENSWDGSPWVIDRSRAVDSHSSTGLKETLGVLERTEIEQLCRLPCIFAYEAQDNIDPQFGWIKDVTVRPNGVRVDYELQKLPTFLTADELERMSFELEILGWELNRTHWAVKDVDLAAELNRKGIRLPPWTWRAAPRINLNDHRFDVALSFPGEARAYVEQVAKHLKRLLGPDRCFYDLSYTAQLARFSLDTFLQGIYRDRSRLIVVFVGDDYQRKDWCGIEFRAIREIINAREHDRVMLVRLDDGEVDGIFSHDGYVDARKYDPGQVAGFIDERVSLITS